MKKSVITNISGNGNWVGNYGTMFSFVIEFEDGESVEANSKTEKPPYSVGDTVWYEIVKENEYGKKGKVTKNDPSQGFQSSPSKSSPDVQARIDASWSIGQAISILASLPPGVSVEKWLSDVDDVSTMLLDLRNKKI